MTEAQDVAATTRESVWFAVSWAFFGPGKGGMARRRGEMRGLTRIADDSLAATIPHEHIGMTESADTAAARVGVWFGVSWASIRHLE